MRGGHGAQQAGFTLVEILVAMCIIGVLSVMLVFATAPDETAQARTEARRLATLLELALAEARASGRSIAWSPVPGGYAFFRKGDDDEWKVVADDGPYQRRSMPAGVSVNAVQFDGQPLREDERIVISPYGLSGIIQATIAGGRASITLRGGAPGRIILESPAPVPGNALLHSERSRIHAS